MNREELVIIAAKNKVSRQQLKSILGERDFTRFVMRLTGTAEIPTNVSGKLMDYLSGKDSERILQPAVAKEKQKRKMMQQDLVAYMAKRNISRVSAKQAIGRRDYDRFIRNPLANKEVPSHIVDSVIGSQH